MSSSRVLALAALSALVLAAPPASAQFKEVRVYPGTTKVIDRGQGLPVGTTAALVEAARGEYEAFQVAVLAGAEGLADVSMAMSDLSGPGGATLPASAAELFYERYVRIDGPSACDFPLNTMCESYPEYVRVPGDYPEQLVPFFDPWSDAHPAVGTPFAVPAGGFATVFADFFVPRDAVAGDWTGTLTVTAAGQAIATVPVTLHVWDFEVPAERSVATAFRFSFNAIPEYHGGASGPDAATYERLRRNYEHEIHRHRIDPTTHDVSLSVQADADGNLLPIDFSAFDAHMAPRIDGSYYPDGAGINRFDIKTFAPGRSHYGLTDAQWAAGAKSVAEHLAEKGWLKHAFMYSTDEPWMPQHAGAVEEIAADVVLMRTATDLWKGHVLVTGPWLQPLDGLVDIWCPVTPMYGKTGLWPEGSWPGPEVYQPHIAAGGELWFYVCNGNYPATMGYDADSPTGHEPRLVKWGSWAEGASGFLFWRLTYWQEPDPWNDLRNVEGFGESLARNGDGILIYPGDHDGTLGGIGSPAGVKLDGPVVSFRLKQIRDGIEDWETFRVAQGLGADGWTREQVARAYTNFGWRLDESFDPENRPWTLDDALLLDARRMIARKIEHLLHPDLYEDPEPAVLPEPSPEAAAEEVAEGVVETAADAAIEPAPEPLPEPAPEPVPDILQATEDLGAADVAVVADEGTKKSGGGGCNGGGAPAPAGWIVLAIVSALVLPLSRRVRRS